MRKILFSFYQCGVSANEYSCAHGAQINFVDLTLYLTYVETHDEEVGRDLNDQLEWGFVFLKTQWGRLR